MNDQSPISQTAISTPISLATPRVAGAAEPAFIIARPAGVASSLLPGGFITAGAAEPAFTISGPGHEARMRALEQRCDALQDQLARLIPATTQPG